MFVIGTSGHVDHGKSTLVEALTGINPDRLPEERQRAMTIDLGFAWMTLPSGREVSIVDVPGHEDFVRNMLAGITGVDVALLVVAADESVMPQTREHLAIIDLLRVPRGVVALTKVDLVTDQDWLGLVVDEVREALAGTVLAESRIVPVSVVTGAGLPELRAEIDRLLDNVQPRIDLGRPRLPIDRVFTMQGFGTIVTGTLMDGSFRVGDEVVVLPGDVRARIRGLQSHRERVGEAAPGSRVAANLAGVDAANLRRGLVVCRPGTISPTQLLDAHISALADARFPIEHGSVLDVHVGSARTVAHVRLLDADALMAGEHGWAQLRLEDPVVAVRGDRFVLRLASPGMTLGGGRVVLAHPSRRYRRRDAQVLARLEGLECGDGRQVLENVLQGRHMTVVSLSIESGLAGAEAFEAARDLVTGGRVVVLGGEDALPFSPISLVTTRTDWEEQMATIVDTLTDYHERYRFRVGMPREELRTRLRMPPAEFAAVLSQAAAEGRVVSDAATVRLSTHQVALDEVAQERVDRLLQDVAAGPASAPSASEAEERLGSELMQYLLDSGQLIRAGEGVLYTREAYEDMAVRLAAHLRARGRATVAEVRDLFGTSRKLALALLEETDRRQLTKRIGDVRVLR